VKLGIFSDIHEDASSLQYVLTQLMDQGCDTLVCLGDIVGYDPCDYGPNPDRDAEACLRMVKEHCSIVVAGNHDLFAAKKVPENTAGFRYPANWYSLPLAERQSRSQRKIWDYCDAEDQIQLSADARNYISSLPESSLLESNGFRWYFAHHMMPDPTGSRRGMPGWIPDLWKQFRLMDRLGISASVSGHTHLHGTLTATRFQLLHTDRSVITLGKRRKWMTCPPVTRGPVTSGYLTANAETGEVTVHTFSLPSSK